MAAAARAGWSAAAARRVDGAERRFLGSGAALAVIDARGAFDEGIAAAAALADAVEANAAALLLLVSRGDVARLDAVHAAGATHYLASPFGDAEFGQALRFAARHADRLSSRRGEVRRTEREAGRATGERRRSARRDPLTGLADAHAADIWLRRALVPREGSDAGCVLLLVSVSRFDTINAAFGRGTGDSLLRSVARRIERLAGVGTRRRLIARVAGAEFAIALAAPATIDEARFLARHIAEAIARPIMSDAHAVALGCRIGIAASAPGDDAAGLMRRASTALAEAKGIDKRAIQVLDAAGEAAGARDSRLEIDLRRALDQDEIEILFQPQVAITSGLIVGVEALARWRHPVFGELGAATLFAAAERSDYLVELSRHVQRKAVRLAVDWGRPLAHLRLSVNVTAADIAQGDLADELIALLGESGFDPTRVTVELTESGLIDDLGAAATLFAVLRRAGLSVAIDDFGTGYSSLAYLKTLPLDYLKIDKGLADDIGGSARDRVVVRGVIEMARSLGLAVIAEGVETRAQLHLLAAEGCNLYQGFLCAPPLDVAALTRLVTAQAR